MPNRLVVIGRIWLGAVRPLAWLAASFRDSEASSDRQGGDPSERAHGMPTQLRVALDSAIVTGLMLVLRSGIALVTGSLSVVAAAADCGLDVAASWITWLAVRFSIRPPDRNHLYGHGKAENLSALTEAILMLASGAALVCVAIRSLPLPSPPVSASAWAFGLMALSLGVDVYRSKTLGAAARRHGSEALWADALRLRSHVWSGVVAMLGLACVKAADWFPAWHALRKGDAIAAVIMAGLFAYISIRLGYQAVEGLLDAAPKGSTDAILKALAPLAGVVGCRAIRARRCGSHLFVDVHAVMNGRLTLRQAHELSDTIEARIRACLPCAEVTVHPEPVSAIADGRGTGVSKHE